MRFQIITEYAIRILYYLGQRPNDLPTAEEIAADMDMTYPYLIRVANQLKKAGLIETERGRYGGYRLACELSEISFMDIVVIMEGKFSISRQDEKNHYGEGRAKCPACQALDGLERAMSRYLNSVSLADIRVREPQSSVY